MEAIQLEIGLELVPFVKTEDLKEGNLINSIRQMRRDMERADHYLIPPIRICDNTSLPPTGSFVAGVLMRFQAWFRDPAAGMSGFNLSDGVEVTFTP